MNEPSETGATQVKNASKGDAMSRKGKLAAKGVSHQGNGKLVANMLFC